MLRSVIRTHRLRLLSAYGLTVLAHLTGQLYPLVTALAINGVLLGDLRPVMALAVWHMLMMALEVAAKMYDTRLFTRVYADLAGGFVGRAHAGGVAPPVVAARAILTREYVDFLEEDLPGGLCALIGLATALIVLTSLDPVVGAACLVLIAPLIVINIALGRRAVLLNRGLNDRLESEVAVLSRGRASSVRRHFAALGAWRIRLSDSEVRAFGLMEVCVIVLIGAALWQLGQGEPQDIRVGDVYAVFSYVWRFVIALDQVPLTVQQIAKLKDLSRRMRLSDAA